MSISKFLNPIRAFSLLSAIALALVSCNRDEEIIAPDARRPEITLDSESGVYTVKTGREIVITPTVGNNENAEYYWILDGAEISRKAQLSRVFDEEGSVFIMFRVVTPNGSDEEEIRIDVVALTPPVISLALPSDGFKALAGREYIFAPDVRHGDEARYAWYLDGEPVADEKNYTFMRQAAGEYLLRITAENEDGSDEKTFAVSVVDGIPVGIVFTKPMWNADPLVRSVPLGRTLYLRPCVVNAVDPEYSWAVDGVIRDGETDRLFGFTPPQMGEYTITFTVTDTDGSSAAEGSQESGGVTPSGRRVTSVELTVTCYGEESTLVKTTSGQKQWNRVYEFLPAPGQFVNETRLAGYSGENTFAQAVSYAETRLAAGNYVSLGGFGGYIIVGFDHSVENRGGYQGHDFSISGNQFAGSSEPGIVWVMQDTNGNGLPDDEWYELKGSEYGKEGTIQEYAVTYYRPAGAGMDVQWTDNLGDSGCIDYLAAYHRQDHYYPLWMTDDTYTLYGVRLSHRTVQQPNGLWYNDDFDWGYVDNYGEDMLTGDDNHNSNAVKSYFKISNAVNLDGSPAGLQYIDFIKVQTGMNVKAGWLGENSTEVFGFADENL